MRNNEDQKEKNIKTVLAILKDEVDGNIHAALEKMTGDYSMTWMYRSRDTLFPTTKLVKEEMKDAYHIRGRKYEIKNIAAGDSVVMVELVESYPNERIGGRYQTPLVLVLEMENGKIKTGRHYCDPQISHEILTQGELDRAYRTTATQQVID